MVTRASRVRHVRSLISRCLLSEGAFGVQSKASLWKPLMVELFISRCSVCLYQCYWQLVQSASMLSAASGSHAGALHEPLLCVFRSALLAGCGSCAGALHEPLWCVFRSTLLYIGNLCRALHEPFLCVFRSAPLAICAERFMSRCCVCLDQRYWQLVQSAS